jgi:hypothetical protein
MSKSEMGGDVSVQLALLLNPPYLTLRRFTQLILSMSHIINPFRSHIGPRPTRFLLRLLARCRSLSDAFPHVVRTLAHR